MRTTSFQEVFNKIVRLYGRDPRKNIESDLRDAVVDHINNRVSTIWKAWRWPEWELTEERAFRQVWNPNHQYFRLSPRTNKPDEVFYLGDDFVDGVFGLNFGYYSVNAAAPIDPPIGTPPTDTDFFSVISPVDTFIEYDQVCKRAIGMVFGVYSQNPRIPTGASSMMTTGNGLLKFMPSEKGLDVLCAGNPTVFVTYKMPTPEYTMLPYVAGKTYSRADVVFDPTTGECFQALSATTALPADNNFWARVPFLKAWDNYVVKGSFSDSLMEFDQGGNVDIQAKVVLQTYWNQQADDSLQAEVDVLTTQGQKLKWSFCQQQSGCWCDSQPWSGGSVTTLSEACEDSMGWQTPVPTQGPAVRWEYRYDIVALKTIDGEPSLQELGTLNYFNEGSLVEVVINDLGSRTQMTFKLVNGPADSSNAGHVQPSDYNATTNNFHWEKCG